MEKKKLTIIALSLLVSLIFFIFKKNIVITDINKINHNRFLVSKEKTDKICSQTSDSFRQKYKSINFDKKEDSQIKKNSNDEDFINLLKDKSISNFSNYLKYLIFRYFLIIILDFILIFFWICYCSCCCSPCCCCKGGRGCCSRLSYSISILTFIGLMAIGVLGLFYGYPLKKNITEASCALFKLFDHFDNGFNEDYSKSKEWIGLNKIYDLLEDTEKIYNLSKIDEIMEKSYESDCIKNNITDEDWSCKAFAEGYDIIKIMKNNYDDDVSKIKNSSDSINKFKVELNNIENKYFKDAYDYLDDYIIKYSHLYSILFALIIVFGLLGLLFLASYVHSCKCIKCCYVILWNLESLFMIIIVLLGVCFGLISGLSQNIISAIDYSMSLENLHNEKQIIFHEKLLDVCFVGDGIISELVEINSTVNENFKNLLIKEENVETNYQNLGQGRQKLKEGYEALRTIINETRTLFNDYGLKEDESIIDAMNCRFIKNDIDIFLGEVRDNLKKTTSRMEIIIYGASLCAGLSIFFGIIVINRYADKKEMKKKEKENDDKDTQIGEKMETERNNIKEKEIEKEK